MNKQATYYFKVGISTFFALGALLAIVLYLNGRLSRGKQFTVLFTDARGIKPAELVRMAGVDVGQIGDVQLTPDNKASLKVSINRGIHIPLGSKFTISNSLIGNQSILTIVPTTNPSDIPDGAVLEGDSSDPFGETLSKSGKLIDTVQQTLLDSQKLVQKLTKSASLLDDPKRIHKIDAMLDNMQTSTAGLPRLEMQVERELSDVSRQTSGLLNGFNETRGTADQVLAGANKLTVGLNDTLVENRKTIRALLKSANDAADQVAGLTETFRTTISDKDLHASLIASSQNLAAATQNLTSISAKLDATASDVQRLADDPRLNADVRETVSNLRESSQSVKDLTARFQNVHIPGEKRPETPRDPNTPVTPHYFSTNSLIEPGLVFDSLYDTKVERLRFDADYTLPVGKQGTFYRAGLYDATYGDRLNLQAGQALFGNRLDYRYGLIAGKLGAGLDFRTGPFDFRFDAYDPNRGTVNARVKANLNAGAAVTAGIDSLGNGNRATVGVQIRK